MTVKEILEVNGWRQTRTVKLSQSGVRAWFTKNGVERVASEALEQVYQEMKEQKPQVKAL